MSIQFHLAQLRHLYARMVNGRVSDTKEAAKGLLEVERKVSDLEQHLSHIAADAEVETVRRIVEWLQSLESYAVEYDDISFRLERGDWKKGTR